VPTSMARRLGTCCISLSAEPGTTINSQWTETRTCLEISVVITDREEHDIAMDLLVCFGQALWEKLSDAELRAYWLVLSEEIGSGVTGEIDEEALEEKRSLLASRSHASSRRRLAGYGRASFAGTAAEYVHCLWHDVTTRTGPGYLPAPYLRRRLDLLARSFPPDRGYHLFPRSGS